MGSARSVIRIIQHETSVETRILAFDHQPYSSNTAGVPDDVVDAVKQGFAKNVPEFDCRQTEWN
jgi:hypothetical protein